MANKAIKNAHGKNVLSLIEPNEKLGQTFWYAEDKYTVTEAIIVIAPNKRITCQLFVSRYNGTRVSTWRCNTEHCKTFQP